MDIKKIKNLNLQIDYDDGADVLYISFGKPRAAISKEVSVGDFVRIDPFTDEVVGVTILDFKERYMSSESSDLIKSAEKILPQILNHV